MDKWIEALRSGKYRQTSNTLRRSEGDGFSYCCLGVACEVKDPSKWGKSAYDASCGRLPASMLAELKLSVEDEQTLIMMNDDSGLSFNEIADWLHAKR